MLGVTNEKQLIERPELAVAVMVVMAGIALRFATNSALWLDEALSVNIARLGGGEIVTALRQDGHPPLYYFLLHLWMRVFGEGDAAVRALSGVLSVATLPLVWMVAVRRGGRDAGIAAVVVLAVLPYATRYATEARMYALVILLVAAGWVMLDRLLEGGSGVWPAVGIGIVTGALLYTHYWTAFLLAAVGLALVLGWLRSGDARCRRRCSWGALAMIGGGVAFLPWLPILLDQLAHTGTPWASAQRPTHALAVTIADLARLPLAAEALVAVLILVVLVGLGLTARPGPSGRLIIDLRTVPGGRLEMGVIGGAVTTGTVVAWVTGSAFASRYVAFVVPVVAVVAGLGVVAVPTRWQRAAVAAVAVVGFGAVSTIGVVDQRSQGRELAEAVNTSASGGDLVLVCPDQLGPAFDRYVDAPVEVVTYPAFDAPERVDWRDYAERNRAADPAQVASRAVEQAGNQAIWLVWMTGYATFEGDCERLYNELSSARRQTLVVEPSSEGRFEPMRLDRFDIHD